MGSVGLCVLEARFVYPLAEEDEAVEREEMMGLEGDLCSCIVEKSKRETSALRIISMKQIFYIL